MKVNQGDPHFGEAMSHLRLYQFNLVDTVTITPITQFAAHVCKAHFRGGQLTGENCCFYLITH